MTDLWGHNSRICVRKVNTSMFIAHIWVHRPWIFHNILIKFTQKLLACQIPWAFKESYILITIKEKRPSPDGRHSHFNASGTEQYYFISMQERVLELACSSQDIPTVAHDNKHLYFTHANSAMGLGNSPRQLFSMQWLSNPGCSDPPVLPTQHESSMITTAGKRVFGEFMPTFLCFGPEVIQKWYFQRTRTNHRPQSN